MKPKFKKFSLVRKTHHNDAKSSSLYDFSDLANALDACESDDVGMKNQSSSNVVSVPQGITEAPDGNPVQSDSKGCYDFTDLSNSLNSIIKEDKNISGYLKPSRRHRFKKIGGLWQKDLSVVLPRRVRPIEEGIVHQSLLKGLASRIKLMLMLHARSSIFSSFNGRKFDL